MTAEKARRWTYTRADDESFSEDYGSLVDALEQAVAEEAPEDWPGLVVGPVLEASVRDVLDEEDMYELAEEVSIGGQYRIPPLPRYVRNGTIKADDFLLAAVNVAADRWRDRVSGGDASVLSTTDSAELQALLEPREIAAHALLEWLDRHIEMEPSRWFEHRDMFPFGLLAQPEAPWGRWKPGYESALATIRPVEPPGGAMEDEVRWKYTVTAGNPCLDRGAGEEASLQFAMAAAEDMARLRESVGDAERLAGDPT